MCIETELALLERIAGFPDRWLLEVTPDNSIPAQSSTTKPPAITEDVVRKRLYSTILADLKDCFQLERCGLLLPFDSERKPGLYGLMSHTGFPPDLQAHRVYRAGYGLTGSALLGTFTTSSDIVRDQRHSGRFGESWISESGELEADHIPRAFAGIPLLNHQISAQRQMIGAVVCIRKREPFSSYEIASLKVAAQFVLRSLGDIATWKQRAEADVRHLAVRMLWHRPMSDDERYYALLELFQPEVPFKRLLLSLVDSDGQHISGKAAIGFRRDLVKETRRQIFVDEPDRPENEDILARMCRLGETKPVVATIKDVHVNHSTALRHHVQNPLLLIPLVRSNHTLLGVLLAELPDSYALHSALSASEEEHFSALGTHFAHLLETHQDFVRAAEDNLETASLINSLTTPSAVNGRNTSASISAIIEGVAKRLQSDYAAVYHYNEPSRIVRRVASVKSAGQLPQLAVPVSSTLADLQLPLTCIRDMKPIEGNLETAVDAEFRKQLPHELKAIAVPLQHERHAIGCLVIAVKSDANIAQIMDKPCIPILSHLLQDIENDEQLKQSSSQASAVLSLIGMLTALFRPLDEPGVGVGKAPRFKRQAIFQAMLQDVSLILQSDLTQLFLPDSPIMLDVDGRIPFEQMNAEFEEVSTFWRRESPTLRDTRRIKTADSRGLTASVLQSMLPQLSENVPDDPLWSHETREFQENEPRSWMGAPLVVSHNGIKYCYGVLSTTRARMFKEDAKAFHEGELRIIRSIAEWLAVAFFQQFRLTDAQFRVEALLRRFNHDLPNIMTNTSNAVRTLTATHATLLATLLRAVDSAPFKKQLAELKAIDEGAMSAASGMLACFRALLDLYLHPADSAVGRPIDLTRVMSCLKQLALIPSVGRRIALELPGTDDLPLGTPRGNEEHVVYVLYLLVYNSFRACSERTKQGSGDQKISSRVRVIVQEANASRIAIRVIDNGCGLNSRFNEKSDIGESGLPGSYWSKPGGGLGLHMARTLMTLMKGEGPIVESNRTGGAIATIFLEAVEYEGR